MKFHFGDPPVQIDILLPAGYPAGEGADLGPDAWRHFIQRKRPGFHDSIRDALEEALPASDKFELDLPDGKALGYFCGSCGSPGAGADMHLGHKENWKDHVIRLRPRTEEAFLAAYNDLGNLHFEHLVCNVSHLFENSALDDIPPGGIKDMDPARANDLVDRLLSMPIFKDMARAEVLELDLTNIFRLLATRYEDDTVATASTLETGDGRKILLADPVVKHNSDELLVVDEMPRPGWDKSTRAGLFTIWKNQTGWTDFANDILHYRCGACGNWGEGFSMHLGHITNWKEYIKKTVGFADPSSGKIVATKAEAQWAYNDLNNLRFEHATCNLGHEWEDEFGNTMVPAACKAWVEENKEHQDVLDSLNFGIDRKNPLIGARLMCHAALDTVRMNQDNPVPTDKTHPFEDTPYPPVDPFDPNDKPAFIITGDQLARLHAAINTTTLDPDAEVDLGPFKFKAEGLREIHVETLVHEVIQNIDTAARSFEEHIVYEVFQKLANSEANYSNRRILGLVRETYAEAGVKPEPKFSDIKLIREAYDCCIEGRPAPAIQLSTGVIVSADEVQQQIVARQQIDQMETYARNVLEPLGAESWLEILKRHVSEGHLDEKGAKFLHDYLIERNK